MMYRIALSIVLVGISIRPAPAGDFADLMQGPKMRFPNRFYYELTRAPGEPFFKCNVQTKTCKQGIAVISANRFVGVILAEDRKTILAHISCYNGSCFNYDTGQISADALPGLLDQED